MIELVAPDQVLETARLRLEPLGPHHAGQLFPVLLDPRMYTYIPDEPLTDQAALLQRCQRLATRRSPDGAELWLNWALQRQPEHDYIGTVQATVYADLHAEIAYLLHPACWGYGYAQEACRCLLTLLFDAYACAEVQAEVDVRNQASWRLLERLGFRQVGFRPAADHFKGASSDEYTYALTREAWRA